MEPPNEAVRSAAPRTPEQAQGHTSWSKAEFLQGITAVPDLQTTGWKSRALNRKDFVSQKCLTLQTQIFQKFTLVWSTIWVPPAQNVSFCFNLFMNELQLQPLSQDCNTPRTGRELSKESNQTEGQKRASIKANHGLFYNPPSLSCTSNHLTFACKSDPFIAELINCIISYNYTYIKYKRSPHLQIHFQKVK